MGPGVSFSGKAPKPPGPSCLVVPASAETGELYCPRMVLNRVDLPELASPRIAALCPSSPLISSCAAVQLTAFMKLRSVERVEGSLTSVEIESRSRGRSLVLPRPPRPPVFFATSCPPVSASRARRHVAPDVRFVIALYNLWLQTESTQGVCHAPARSWRLVVAGRELTPGRGEPTPVIQCPGTSHTN